MPSILDQTVFSEPSGRPLGLVYLCGALLLSGSYGYYVVVRDFTPDSFVLILSAGMALSGIAESLPKPRRRAAGVLRLTAISVLVCLLVTIFFAPELLTE
ncbi:hypothetical protein [Halobaculum limi]|uniref:hypothetical protein n=1 Tax=Halobaculum limi TaxID=3031916 RepID=UPI0024059552|nr:hypothetical protein [Halobaculum sp. YSMS11]